MEQREPTRTSLRQLFSDSALYVVGNLLRRGFSLVTMPVFTRYLAPSGYGVLGIVGAVQNMLEVVYELGMASAGTRFYYECRDQRERQRLFGTLLLVSLAATSALTLLLLTVGPWLWQAVGKDIPFYPYLALTVGTVWAGSLGVLPRVLFRVENRVPTFLFVSLMQTAAMALLAIGLVVVGDSGPAGPVTATFAVSIVFVAVYAWYLRGRTALAFDRPVARRALLFGLPDIPMHMGTWVLKMIDRLFLQHFVSLAAVGVYSVGYSISKMPFDLVGNGIHWAIVPFFYATAKDQPDVSAKATLSRVATYNVTVLAGLGVATVLFARDLVTVLASAHFAEAVSVMPLCVAASFLHTLAYIPSKGIYLTGKTWILPLVVAAGAVVNIGLNVLLIPSLGMMGAAWASFGGYGVSTTLIFAVSQRLYPIPYEYGRIAKAMLAAVAVGLAGTLTPDGPLMARVMVKALLLAGFPGALWALGFFEPREIDWLRRWVAAALTGRA